MREATKYQVAKVLFYFASCMLKKWIWCPVTAGQENSFYPVKMLLKAVWGRGETFSVKLSAEVIGWNNIWKHIFQNVFKVWVFTITDRYLLEYLRTKTKKKKSTQVLSVTSKQNEHFVYE